MTENRTLVLIPARMAATRLPGKPLLDIAGAADDRPRAAAGRSRRYRPGRGRHRYAGNRRGRDSAWRRGGHDPRRPPLRLGPDLRGADRRSIPTGKIEIVVNLQGDFPTIAPENIRAVLPPLADPAVDIATLAAEIHTEEEAPTRRTW